MSESKQVFEVPEQMLDEIRPGFSRKISQMKPNERQSEVTSSWRHRKSSRVMLDAQIQHHPSHR
ncbi:MAG TPA: hypothetical protein PLX77_07410, partial [Candidatus Cloacimonadota bacterium]|nr:hypothetical protein [Candidatus Cloacimonadota bacterium]